MLQVVDVPRDIRRDEHSGWSWQQHVQRPGWIAREPLVEPTWTDDDRHPIVEFRDEGIRACREHREPWGRT